MSLMLLASMADLHIYTFSVFIYLFNIGFKERRFRFGTIGDKRVILVMTGLSMVRIFVHFLYFHSIISLLYTLFGLY